MKANEFVIEKMPKARAEKKEEKGSIGKHYWLIINGNKNFPIAEGKTESTAWVNAKRVINEIQSKTTSIIKKSIKMKPREIKFRGWDGNKMIFMHKGEFMLDAMCNIQIPSSTGHEWYTKDYPLMLHRGLKDNDGKEIYEGDVCWTYEIGFGVVKRIVVFVDGCFCFRHKNGLDVQICLFKREHIEIIGNIFENPRLLNQK